MIENDRIPLETWEKATAADERLGWELVPVVSSFESTIERAGDAEPTDARELIEKAVAEAAPMLDERARSLGFSLPLPVEIDTLLERGRGLSSWIAAARDPDERLRRRSDAFGAALRALIRKRGPGATAAGSAFRRDLPVHDGIRVDLPNDERLEIALDGVLLPTIAPDTHIALAETYSPEDWLFHTEGNGVHVMMNRGAAAAIQLPPRTHESILLLRYFAVADANNVYTVRLRAAGETDEQEVAQSESRLARLRVPASAERIELSLIGPGGVPAPLAMHVRITVCRLVPVRWRVA